MPRDKCIIIHSSNVFGKKLLKFVNVMYSEARHMMLTTDNNSLVNFV